MNQKKIIVKIDSLGSPTVEAEGFYGVGCVDATKNIEDALTSNPSTNSIRRELKSSYYENESSAEIDNIYGGY